MYLTWKQILESRAAEDRFFLKCVVAIVGMLIAGVTASSFITAPPALVYRHTMRTNLENGNWSETTTYHDHAGRPLQIIDTPAMIVNKEENDQ